MSGGPVGPHSMGESTKPMSGTRACSQCGTVVPSDAGFCAKCGTQVFAAAGSVDPSDPNATQIDAGPPPTVHSEVSQTRLTAQRLAQATQGEFEILERLGFGAMARCTWPATSP